MKNIRLLLVVTVVSAISGCASMDKKAVLGLANAGYDEKNIVSSLEQIRKEGFFCQEMPVGPNPFPAFKRYTSDGTLNDLKMFQCMRQSDYFFWLTTTYTYVMGQYGKVVGIGHLGSYRTKTYLWEQEPPKAVCISKCLNSSGNVE